MYESFARLDQMSVVNEKNVPDAVAVAMKPSIFFRTFCAISGMIDLLKVDSEGTAYLSFRMAITIPKKNPHVYVIFVPS